MNDFKFSDNAKQVNDNLIIYGSGDVTSLKLYAESLGIGQRVHLPGQISDVPTFIKSARLFVLSSNVAFLSRRFPMLGSFV